MMSKPRKSKPARKDGRTPNRKRDSAPKQTGGGRYWLAGAHPVTQALKNQDRRIFRLVATERAAEEIAGRAAKRGIPIELADRDTLERLVGADVVHQGLAAETAPLDPLALSDLPEATAQRPILVLDQITDPRNVGAILRSAAVFGAVAVVVQDRNAPPETSVLAKAASGALETVPLVRVGNLIRALDSLKEAGYWVAGMAGEATETLSALPTDRPLALILGAEGDGMRRLTRDACDVVVKIPMVPNDVGSLNVSNAAAVVLYAATVT